MKTQKGKSNICTIVFGVLMESECELVVKAKDSEKKRVTLLFSLSNLLNAGTSFGCKSSCEASFPFSYYSE